MCNEASLHFIVKKKSDSDFILQKYDEKTCFLKYREKKVWILIEKVRVLRGNIVLSK